MSELSSSDFKVYDLYSCHDEYPKCLLTHFHRHNEVELNFLSRGTYNYTLGARVMPLPVRSLSVFWAGFSHRCVEWTPDVDIWAFCIPMTIFLSWGLPRKTFVHPLLNGEMLRESDPAAADADEALMRRWHDDINNSAPPERIVRCEALLFEVRARLMRLALNAGNVPARSGAEPGCVGVMLQHIAAHYRDPNLSTRDIARHAGLHPGYAAEVFKKSCGISLMRYVSQQRVTHAQRLLATTGAKVLDIAMDAGFGSVSQFHHVFHTVTGTSPREYARAHGNEN